MRMTEKTKKTISVVANVLLWGFVAFSFLTTMLVFAAQNSDDGIPSVFGKAWITIQTPSMDPTYKVGDLVFMTKLSAEEKRELQDGDIITYWAPIDINGDGSPNDLNTHRIVEINHETGVIHTRGDNPLASNDTYTISYSDVVGLCTENGKSSGIGGVIDFLRSSVGFFVCVIIPLALFFIYEMYNFISILVTTRLENKTAVSKETEEEIKRRAIEEYLKQQAEENKENP